RPGLQHARRDGRLHAARAGALRRNHQGGEYQARVKLEVRRIAGALGAEILGVDLTLLSSETVAAIGRAFLDHQVVFLLDQPLTEAKPSSQASTSPTRHCPRGCSACWKASPQSMPPQKRM